MDELIKVPFNRATHRANLLWGGEREYMIMGLAMTAIMIATSMNIPSIIAGVVFGVISVWGLRAMAKADPIMSKVYKREVMYRSYYPTYSRPYRSSNNPRVY